ncbi:putative membrane protein [Halobacteriovorax marinus SJ]|uniref:Membrane protein n=1 Tax=Halobacteriovorax marinus (strain ATCC BAA-682 / DSM 15412 / SJ) TaxID=862908 RepID=E1WZ43_HALMS|nr:prepilin-type N-terminal cleavage/methylation domain-containing protein [Halobacteriovorax marinus]CBW26140.1 putative membrane protein [Halobacteriovorax marinus SJ]
MKDIVTGNNKGFTLIEMLVALLLVTIVLTVVSGTSFSTRRNLDEALNDVERAVRFSVDEAALKNSMLRVRFKFDEDPQTWSVEFGPSGNFVLPPVSKSVSQSKSEEEAEKKTQDQLNKKFSRVREFQDGDREFPLGIRVIGLATNLTQAMLLDGDNSLYIYPTGEKDSAIIIIASDDELAALKISPFTMDIEREYFSVETSDSTDITEAQIELAERIFQEWQKN